MIVPAIKTQGVFTFSPPFDIQEINNKYYTVVSVRLLKELFKNEDDPLHTIYLPRKLTEEDFQNDLKNDVPIVGLSDQSSRLVYIPANRIIGTPKLSGVPYRRKMINVSLGLLPDSYGLEGIASNIRDVVMDGLGIIPEMKVSINSATELKTEQEHEDYIRRLSNHPRVRVFKSDRQKYLELKKEYDDLKSKYDDLTEFMSSTWDSNVNFLTDIPAKTLEVMTKKIVINYVGEVGTKSFCLNQLGFILSSYLGNTTSPVYAKGFTIRDVTSKKSFYGMLGDKTMTISVTEGEIKDSHLPYVFSDMNTITFYPFDNKTETGINKVSRGTIEIELDSPLYITGLNIKLIHSDDLVVDKCRFILYNKDDRIVYNTTFERGTDFSSLSPILNKNFKDALQLRNDIPHPLPDN